MQQLNIYDNHNADNSPRNYYNASFAFDVLSSDFSASPRLKTNDDKPNIWKGSDSFCLIN